MKTTAKVIGILLAIVLCLAAYPAYRIFEFQHYYGEAEPLVQTVWPLAHSFQKFEDRKERRPVSLSELVEFSGDDLTPIENYPHTLHESGPLIFEMEVNRKYGFKIDEDYRPFWTTNTEKQNKTGYTTRD